MSQVEFAAAQLTRALTLLGKPTAPELEREIGHARRSYGLDEASTYQAVSSAIAALPKRDPGLVEAAARAAGLDADRLKQGVLDGLRQLVLGATPVDRGALLAALGAAQSPSDAFAIGGAVAEKVPGASLVGRPGVDLGGDIDAGEAFVVQSDDRTRYVTYGFAKTYSANSPDGRPWFAVLGAPLDDQRTHPLGGSYQRFEHGVMRFRPGESVTVEVEGTRPGATNPAAEAQYQITGTTGPFVSPIVSHWGRVSFDAKPGATWRVTDLNATHRFAGPDGVLAEQPVTFASGTIDPQAAPPFAGEGFRARVTAHLKIEGPIWRAWPGDRLAIYVTNPGESESEPTFVDLPKTHQGQTQFTRPPIVRPDRVIRRDEVIESTAPYAVPAGAPLRLFADGVATEVTSRADEFGHFGLPIPIELRGRALSVVAEHPTAPARVDFGGRLDAGPKRLAEIQIAIQRAVEAGGVIQLDRLPAGFWIELESSVGPRRAVADDRGRLRLDLPPAAAGSAITVQTAPLSIFEPGKMTYRGEAWLDRPIFAADPASPNSGRVEARAIHITLPFEAGQPVRAITEALEGTTPENVEYALRLFGPDSPHEGLRGLTDRARIGAVFTGAQLGFLAKASRTRPDVVEKAIDRLAERVGLSPALREDLRQGARLAQFDRGPGPGGDDNVRLNPAAPDRSAIDVRGPSWLVPPGEVMSFRAGE